MQCAVITHTHTPCHFGRRPSKACLSRSLQAFVALRFLCYHASIVCPLPDAVQAWQTFQAKWLGIILAYLLHVCTESCCCGISLPRWALPTRQGSLTSPVGIAAWGPGRGRDIGSVPRLLKAATCRPQQLCFCIVDERRHADNQPFGTSTAASAPQQIRPEYTMQRRRFLTRQQGSRRGRYCDALRRHVRCHDMPAKR